MLKIEGRGSAWFKPGCAEGKSSRLEFLFANDKTPDWEAIKKECERLECTLDKIQSRKTAKEKWQDFTEEKAAEETAKDKPAVIPAEEAREIQYKLTLRKFT